MVYNILYKIIPMGGINGTVASVTFLGLDRSNLVLDRKNKDFLNQLSVDNQNDIFKVLR